LQEDHLATTIKQLEMRAAEKAILMAGNKLGLNLNEVASALDVHPRTVYRYKNHESAPSPDVRDRLGKLREISQLLTEVFVDQEARLTWLYSEVPMLRGQLPIDVIRKGELDEVISILAGLYSGAFA
jgi:uncharacterized protein (DUF2384 family)